MPSYNVDINEVIQQDFLEYTGHVMQERSIPDARDGLKDGARKILYSQFIGKNTYNDRYQKGQTIAAQSMVTGFLHGDSSAYSTLVRMGKPFAMPYPFEEIQGNGGNQVDPENHAAGRYLECKMSQLGTMLFDGIKKNAINEWYWNYSDTIQLPRVVPSYGFYPIINGALGISVGLSTSIPSTNLREVNNAIIKLMKNPEIGFEEIYCAPDFPMGGFILNGKEVKESMKNGCGKAVRIRSKIDYDADKNTLTATQIPFSVYTHTIDAELEAIINGDEKSGIKKYIDATNDEGAKIIIYLEKGTNPQRVVKRLYKETSLESYYGINLIMLDNGRFPKVFSWKEALQAYITHIRSCKTREVQFDLDKALSRKNIVEGLICAAASIDEVVSLIRGSANPAEASSKLIARFGFNEEQVKAILAMKLSSLTKIDAIKLEDEKKDLLSKIEWFQHLLNDAAALDEELIKVLREVAEKFGDERRTKILNVAEEEEEGMEEVQEDELEIAIYDNNTICAVKKGEKRKTKLKKNVKQIGTLYSTNFGRLSIFTKDGKMYSLPLSEVECGTDFVLPYSDVVVVIDNTSLFNYRHIIFITKQGMLKKSKTSEYNCRIAAKGTIALKLREDDSVVNVFFSSNENDRILIAANTGYAVFYNHSEIAAIGRASMGVKAIKLKEKEYVADATIIKESMECKEILTISTKGKEKTVPIAEIAETSRAIKGNLLRKLKDGEELFICQGQP